MPRASVETAVPTAPAIAGIATRRPCRRLAGLAEALWPSCPRIGPGNDGPLKRNPDARAGPVSPDGLPAQSAYRDASGRAQDRVCGVRCGRSFSLAPRMLTADNF